MARLLTCPDCGASYRVPEAALTESGQNVRCQKCANVWFVPGEGVEADALALADLEVADDMERPPAPAPVGAKDMNPNGPDAASAYRQGTHARRRRKRVNIILLIWAATLGILVAALLIAVINRHRIVEQYPQLASVFTTLGLETSPNGFRLDAPEVQQVRLDGVDYLVVEGRVVNLTSESRTVPPVQLALLDVGGGALAEWDVDVDAQVAAGESATYLSEYPNPPLDAATLRWEMGE